jgi:oxidoreductase
MINEKICVTLFKMSEKLIALVTGYTGESGKALLKELVKNNQFKKIILVGRRQVDFTENEYNEKTVFILNIL